MVKRYVAKKVRVADITNGKYSPGAMGEGEDYKPSYVITSFGEKISRANIVATVTEKFKSPDTDYASITLDDGTDAIRAKAFGKDVNIFDKIEEGSFVIVVGKVKEYQGEVYINAEIARQVEPQYENLRKLEILEALNNRKGIIDNLRKMQSHFSREDMIEHAKRVGIDEDALDVVLEKKEADYKPKILEIIDSLDSGEGAEIGKVFEVIKLPEATIERAVDELLAEGSIYEPMPGRFKKI